MTVTTKKGKRHPKDTIVLYNGKVISPYDMIQILILFWNNEDTIRPSSDKGAKMLFELINEAFEKREITDEMVWRYSLTRTK